jgi:hypothetical protein
MLKKNEDISTLQMILYPRNALSTMPLYNPSSATALKMPTSAMTVKSKGRETNSEPFILMNTRGNPRFHLLRAGEIICANITTMTGTMMRCREDQRRGPLKPAEAHAFRQQRNAMTLTAKA